MPIPNSLRYLLLQIRKPEDPMRAGEVDAFAWALGCSLNRIKSVDLILEPPSTSQIQLADIVLIGGAGDFSVPQGGTWLDGALDAMRELHALAKPTFASCWGFQAMAAALGGEVITDDSFAEIGTIAIDVTEPGSRDPLFKHLESPFFAHVGHHDTVVRRPPGTTGLARTNLVENHAFRFDGLPIYCTQFHSELRVSVMKKRLKSYPTYVERIAGMTLDKFVASLRETPEANSLIRRFAEHYFGS